MMHCSRCGDPVDADEKFCNKCGTPVVQSQSLFNSTPVQIEVSPKKTKRFSFKGLFIGLGICCIFFLVLYITDKDFYFETNDDIAVIIDSEEESSRVGKYSTAIVYDHTYVGVSISKKEEAYSLIVKDSVSQKNVCPAAIKEVENDIIQKYGITAVNLCEMDVDFARELGNVFKKIYHEYPSVRGYITNLTLVNASISENYIAAFMPVFTFATSDSSSTLPWVIKTQIMLNTSYFLNRNRLRLSVENGSNSGHFPRNATIYSPVAHELGHYISFIAIMKSYESNSILLINNNNIEVFYNMFETFKSGSYSLSILQEAYQRYQKDTDTKLSFDEWRGTISHYALSKDNNGNYLYDETIAEAFHDSYLNGDKAVDASKYIVTVLKEKLKG